MNDQVAALEPYLRQGLIRADLAHQELEELWVKADRTKRMIIGKPLRLDRLQLLLVPLVDLDCSAQG